MLEDYQQVADALGWRVVAKAPRIRLGCLDAQDISQMALIYVWETLKHNPTLPRKVVIYTLYQDLWSHLLKRKRSVTTEPLVLDVEDVEEANEMQAMNAIPKNIVSIGANPETQVIQRDRVRTLFQQPGFKGQVAQLLAQGYTHKEIAEQLHITLTDVLRYQRQIRCLAEEIYA